MKSWIYLILVVALPIASLTGCISKQPVVLDLSNAELNEENSKEHKDPKGRFSLRLPEEFELVADQEEDTARLFRINITGSAETVMFIEESLTSLSATVDLMTGREEFTEDSRESIKINGLEGVKLNVELTTDPGKVIPYYFLYDGSNYSYIFNHIIDTPFEHYLGLVNSFQLIN